MKEIKSQDHLDNMARQGTPRRVQLTDKQFFCLQRLRKALREATENGLMDDYLPSRVHPDVINQFCDAVADEEGLL